MKKIRDENQPNQEIRKKYDQDRHGSERENALVEPPDNSKTGYTVIATPVDANQPPAIPPISAGKHWNATRPKASASEKS